MKWEHECSLEWLQKRQDYLTASDIKSLLPFTRTGRKRTVGDAEYLKVRASKMIELTEDDCWSYGAAARGHIMEPYAVEELNALLKMHGVDEQFHWWDDELISLPDRSIAFSPDAMDEPVSKLHVLPTAIAEIKSYEASKHLSLAYTDKGEIEERWQIATAMALLDSIDHAYLVLYNPKMQTGRMFVVRFDREDLEDEIEGVLEVERNWDRFVRDGPRKPSDNRMVMNLGTSEQEIISKLATVRRRLNPV